MSSVVSVGQAAMLCPSSTRPDQGPGRTDAPAQPSRATHKPFAPSHIYIATPPSCYTRSTARTSTRRAPDPGIEGTVETVLDIDERAVVASGFTRRAATNSTRRPPRLKHFRSACPGATGARFQSARWKYTFTMTTDCSVAFGRRRRGHHAGHGEID